MFSIGETIDANPLIMKGILPHRGESVKRRARKRPLGQSAIYLAGEERPFQRDPRGVIKRTERYPVSDGIAEAVSAMTMRCILSGVPAIAEWWHRG